MCAAFRSDPDFAQWHLMCAAIDTAIVDLDFKLRVASEEILEDLLFPEFIMWCILRITHTPAAGPRWNHVITLHHYNLVSIIESRVNRIYVSPIPLRLNAL